ncbi:MAG TPA: 7-carboxy-7-deazaguanine synthase QueE [Oculatellaceae cyanobacterium]
MLGRNPVRHQILDQGEQLWIQEVFYTLQGEGPFSGHPAVFVRLAGCNLKCFWCDTDFESSQWHPNLEELLAQIEKVRPTHCKLIVLTGGEPFRQNIAPLINALLTRKLHVQLETNGTLWLDLPNSPDISIVCSPKTGSLNSRIVPRITAYKYVLAADSSAEDDGLPKHSTQEREKDLRLARPPAGSQVYVMPLDEGDERQNAENRRHCVAIAKAFGYKLTLQTHKILGID